MKGQIGQSLCSFFLINGFKIMCDLACRSDGTLHRCLLNLADPKSPASATPIGDVKSYDCVVDDSQNLWFRLFVPDDVDDVTQTSLPVLVYFHGGGFATLSPKTIVFNVLCRRLAAAIPAVVISVNYRHSPEVKYPAQYDDGFDVLKYIDANYERIDHFPAKAELSQCFLAGDSAGGNLAHHMAVKAAESGFKTVRIRGLIGIQPFFGGEDRTNSELRLGKNTWLTLKRTDFFWKAFLPEGSDRNHPASNVFGQKSKDLSSLKLFPPTLVVIGGKDLLQDWQRKYCEWLERSGKEVELVEYPNVQHVFYLRPELPEYSILISRIGEFLHKQLKLSM